MPDYRAYLIGRNGNIVDRVDMFCDDDEAANVRGQLLIDVHTVELWQGDLLVRGSPLGTGIIGRLFARRASFRFH